VLDACVRPDPRCRSVRIARRVVLALVPALAATLIAERTDWWRTCCEPGQIDDPRNAGLARVIVRLDTDTGSHRYVFEMLARETSYWGDAAGYPAHDWTLRDVYRVGDAPRFARFADVSAMHPDVIAAVRRYYDRYAEAFVACDIRLLWEKYPALAQGTDLGAGINSEGTHVSGMCGARPVTARFDLEWGGPLRLHLHGEGVDVTVHGLEEFDLTPGRSAGEFQTTLSLRRVEGPWLVVRTDEVTLAEWHRRGHSAPAAIGRGPAVPFPPLRNTIAPVLAGFRDPGRPAGH